MVFCGKASGACQPCRSKRRKCDLARPSCSQCIRANISCSGYRDVAMLSFRDQTATVLSKAQKGKHGSTRSVSKRSKSPPPPAEFSLQHYDIAPVYGLSLDIESIATNHFLDRYMPDTAFSYLIPHWNGVADEQIVKTAVLPIAIAAFSQCLRQPGLLEHAATQYSIALSATNNALSKPGSATCNGTLLSVLLLTMYEALTFRGRRSPQNWIMHVNGLATILQMREEETCHDELGGLLARHASNHILSNCAQQSIPIPRHVQEVRQRRIDTLGPHTLPVDIAELLGGVAVLSADRRCMSATEVVVECLRLDCFVEAALQRLHVLSPYTVLPYTSNFGEVYNEGSHVHQYESQNAVRHWNNMRSLRLVLNEWIYETTTGEFSRTTNSSATEDALCKVWNQLPKRALLNFEKALGDVLASIPYSRGYLGNSYIASPRFLIWPLSKGATSELCSPEVREFIIKSLMDIGVEDNSEQAREAAMMLQEEVPVEDWSHIYQFS